MLHTPHLNQSVPNRFEQRDSFRISNPALQVEIDGTYFLTENWSLNGLLIKGLKEDIELDQQIQGTFGPDKSAELCKFSGRIVRIDLKNKQFAIELDGTSKEVAALLPFWVLKYGTR
ncbi:PilZ domain-containing protein [Sneathiella glossodoripedis]|uniref:PilZ domain-containing protein n=1 Tax=Sneathiella glossodoripedis TaxID=418853 RepID=UPI0011DDE027|nr:PilZ domain-containing protein [Sneathiella glossodoripedis]